MLVFLLGKFMRKVFFGQLRAAEMEVVTLFPLKKRKKVSLMTFQYKYSGLTFSLLSAPHRALLVCSDGDVPGLHRVQGRLLPALCGPLHPPALPQVLPLVG